MRKIVLVAAATAGVLALSACKGEEKAPEATEAASAEPAMEATDAAATDAAPTEAASSEAAKM